MKRALAAVALVVLLAGCSGSNYYEAIPQGEADPTPTRTRDKSIKCFEVRHVTEGITSGEETNVGTFCKDNSE